VLAPPNPLRGLVGDAAAVSAVAGAIDGPVVLVGHSYGGAFQFIETGIFAALAAALIAVTFFVVRRRDA
jgi:pimeloyl-ACP methyl ester carboxylesterase